MDKHGYHARMRPAKDGVNFDQATSCVGAGVLHSFFARSSLGNPQMTRLVIGITGPIGSGVSTTADSLSLHGFQKLKISDAIRKEAQKKLGDGILLSLDHDGRKLLQDTGNEFRKDNAAYWVIRAMEEQGVINSSGKVIDETSDIVIESIRNPLEAKALLTLFAPNFFLIAIQASRDTRWQGQRTLSPLSVKDVE